VRDGEGAGRVPRGAVHDVPVGAAGGSAVTDPPAVSPHDVGATALALALCRWCSCPYLAVRGRHGQSSLASHEKQCRLNPRGRRRGRDDAAADAAPTLLRAVARTGRAAGQGAAADLFSADPAAWARGRDAFLLRVAPAGALWAPIRASGPRTLHHLPSALLGAWQSLVAEALDWVRRQPDRQSAWL